MEIDEKVETATFYNVIVLLCMNVKNHQLEKTSIISFLFLNEALLKYTELKYNQAPIQLMQLM